MDFLVFNGLFLPQFPSSRRIYIRLRGGKRRFFSLRLGHISALASSTQFTTEMPLCYLKSAYPICQIEEAVSNFALETASFRYQSLNFDFFIP